MEGSSSGGSDAFADVDVSEADMNLIIDLEERVEAACAAGGAAAAGSYDSHATLVGVLRRCGVHERLAEARRAMAERFPLEERLWLEWLEDEAGGAGGAAAPRERLAALFEAAVGDYLSVPVWLRYLEWARGADAGVAAHEPAAVERLRALHERALAAGGLHLAEGGALWRAARAFEQALAVEGDAVAAARARALFRRQLATPLADHAETLAEYAAWEAAQRAGAAEKEPDAEADPVPKAARRVADVARRAVELRAPFEAAVARGAPADGALLAAYIEYARLEEGSGEPARAAALYERALAAFPVTLFLWLQYGRRVEAAEAGGKAGAGGGGASAAAAVYARACRNCPWAGEAWARRLRAAERAGAPPGELDALAAAARDAGLAGPADATAVAAARVDAARRAGAALPALRAALQEALRERNAAHPEFADPELLLESYWADLEARLGGAEGAAGVRAAWAAALASPAARRPEAWLAAAAAERRAGAPARARVLLERAAARRLEAGGAAAVAAARLRFEREEGSAAEHLAACLAAEPVLAEAEAAAAAAQAQAAAAQAAAARPKPPPRGKPPARGKPPRDEARPKPPSREEARAARQAADPNFKRREREAGAAAATAPAPKRAKTAKGAAPPPAAAAAPAPNAAAAAPAPAAQEAAPSAVAAPAPQDGSAAPAAAPAATAPRPAAAAAAPAGRAAVTAFVKGLPASADEAALREFFAAGGAPPAAVRLATDAATGHSRGFAYVEFTTPEALAAAVALDGAELRGKAVAVARSAPRGARGGGRAGGAGGREGGRGGRSGGRGREGGRGGGLAGGLGHQRAAVDVSAAAAFVPRAAALRKPAEAPKSNEEFRRLLLEGKKE